MSLFEFDPRPLSRRDTINDRLELLTIADIVNHKRVSRAELKEDLFNLDSYNGEQNANNFAGNRFLYHFQFANLLHCTRERSGRPRETIYEIWADPEKRAHLIEQTRLRDRGGRVPANNVFEAYRINTGSIVMFKAVTAKYLYLRYGATRVLDPTAGWGGRMLGAWSLGIDYTGIDLNVEMKSAYDEMMAFLHNFNEIDNPLFEVRSTSKLEMIWDSALNVDFSKIDYDFVLTSPPYINMELYRNMPPWATDQAFYEDFFIPLFDKCRAHIRKGGTVCFNISPKMYDDALTYGLPACDSEEDLLQRMGQAKGRKKQDKIYIWRC
jgi:hypothetical protein